MSYEAEAIANAFIKLAKDEGKPLSPMKLQKLLYFAQGHSLSLRNEELITDNCQAWAYGPVFPSVYHELKKYGSGEITALIEDHSDEPEQVGRFDPPTDSETCKFLSVVWDNYKSKPAIALSEMSHVPNGPWAQVFNKMPRNSVIPKRMIEDYFNGLKKN